MDAVLQAAQVEVPEMTCGLVLPPASELRAMGEGPGCGAGETRGGDEGHAT